MNKKVIVGCFVAVAVLFSCSSNADDKEDVVIDDITVMENDDEPTDMGGIELDALDEEHTDAHAQQPTTKSTKKKAKTPPSAEMKVIEAIPIEGARERPARSRQPQVPAEGQDIKTKMPDDKVIEAIPIEGARERPARRQ